MLNRRDRVLEELEELYRRRFTHFVAVARAIVGDQERAVDAVQDGFSDAIRARSSFRREGPIEAWVWRAVVNRARQIVRRPRLELVSEEEPIIPDSPVFAASPLLGLLPERQRLIAFLRYYADLDYRAIADALEIEVGTVSASLAAAHRTIRTALQEAEHG